MVKEVSAAPFPRGPPKGSLGMEDSCCCCCRAFSAAVLRAVLFLRTTLCPSRAIFSASPSPLAIFSVISRLPSSLSRLSSSSSLLAASRLDLASSFCAAKRASVDADS